MLDIQEILARRPRHKFAGPGHPVPISRDKRSTRESGIKKIPQKKRCRVNEFPIKRWRGGTNYLSVFQTIHLPVEHKFP